MAGTPVLRIQALGVIAVAFGSLALGLFLIDSAYREYTRAALVNASIIRQHAVIQFAQAIANERSRATLDIVEVPVGSIDTLQQRREQSARSLDRLKRVMASSPDAEEQRLLVEAETLANAARKVADDVAARPFAARSRADVAAAMKMMFAASDTIGQLRERAGQRAMRSASEIAGDVIVGTTVSGIRDAAGRIGSTTIVQLMEPRESADPELTREFQQEIGRVTVLTRALVNVLAPLFDSAAIEQAAATMEQRFVQEAMPLAIRANRAARDGVYSPKSFGASYVEGVRAIDDLFQVVIEASERRAAERQEAAYRRLVWSIAMTAIFVLALGAIGLLLRNRLFRPLRGAREQIAAIAGGEVSDTALSARMSSEMRDILPELDLLRLNQLRLKEDQQRLDEELGKLAETDQLTGLLNRRALIARGRRLLAEDAHDRAIGVVIFDLDAFRWINSGGGYQAGDEALRKIAIVLRGRLSGADLFARCGGDEFAIVLADTSRQAAIEQAERLRADVIACAVAGHGPALTASFGLALREAGSAAEWEELVSIAERRMAQAKRAGGNRVCFSNEDWPPRDQARKEQAA